MSVRCLPVSLSSSASVQAEMASKDPEQPRRPVAVSVHLPVEEVETASDRAQPGEGLGLVAEDAVLAVDAQDPSGSAGGPYKSMMPMTAWSFSFA